MVRRVPRRRSARLASFAKRLRSISRTPRIRRSRSNEALEPLAALVFGGEVAGAVQGVGSGLGGEQALQLQGLLDAKTGELVTGLGDVESAACVGSAGHGVSQ